MSEEESRVGSVIASKYRLDEELGRGGMGAVYKAFHLRVHKVFALKMLLGDVARHRSSASRFLLEAQAAGRIGHPGILEVYDVGEDADGAPFIVMELLRGEALSQLVGREKLEVDAACWIAMQVLDILEAAHKAAIIHRDVKPQNVFITEKGDERAVKLLDFGIAKFSGIAAEGNASVLTRSGEIIGSPLYMSPEQAKGEADLDERADVWSVGAMLFEMLTGNCAHAATSPVAVLAKVLTVEAPAPSAHDALVPKQLDVVVQKALKIDRAERWPNARTMREALAEVRAELGTSEKVPKIAPAVKTSVPPPSTDRMPGAISSTVHDNSERPPRPWSAGPPPSPEAVAATVRAEETTGPTAKKRSPLVNRIIVGVVITIAIIAAKRFVITPPEHDHETHDSDTPARVAVPVVPEAVVAVSALPPAEPLPVLVDADAGAAGKPRAPLAAPTGPKCGAGEVVSNGHCCSRGLEWKDGRCERPIATTF